MTSFGEYDGGDRFHPPLASRKVLAKEMYHDLTRLADDGCPLVTDLENYDVVEIGEPPETGN